MLEPPIRVESEEAKKILAELKHDLHVGCEPSLLFRGTAIQTARSPLFRRISGVTHLVTTSPEFLHTTWRKLRYSAFIKSQHLR